MKTEKTPLKVPNFSVLKALKIAVALIFLGVPMLASIPSIFIHAGYTGFIPSIELRAGAEIFALFSGVAYLSFFLFAPLEGTKRNWFTSARPLTARPIWMLIFMPIFGVFTGHAFVYGALSYVLHSYASQPGMVVENVVGIGRERRPCTNTAQLENSSWLWKRRICNLSREAQSALHGGGQLQLTGTVSRFGVNVDQYSVIKVDHPSFKLQTPAGLGTLSDPATAVPNAPKSQND